MSQGSTNAAVAERLPLAERLAQNADGILEAIAARLRRQHRSRSSGRCRRSTATIVAHAEFEPSCRR